MKVEVNLETQIDNQPLKIGNVYNIKGGACAKLGHMMVLISVTSTTAIFITINRHGDIVGCSNYSRSNAEERTPIAYVDGLDDLILKMRSL